MAIDPNNPLLNGPRRVDARPVVRFTAPPPVEPHPDGPLFEAAATGHLRLSEAEILAARTPKGSWTRATLAGWGVAWPPPKGWKERLIQGLPQEAARGPVAAPQLPLLSATCCASRVPNPDDPAFDSTIHGLLAPPRVTYRRREE